MEAQRQKRLRDGMLIVLLVAATGLCYALKGSIPGFLLTTLCGAGLGILALGWLLPVGLLIALVWIIASILMRSGNARAKDTVVRKALAGVQRTAGIGAFQLNDIGILAYDGGKRPNVSRHEAIPAYATQLRPFVIINATQPRPTTHSITFEMIDEQGHIRFMDVQSHAFQQGKNFIVPSQWLLRNDDKAGGDWSLRISMDERPLALHAFKITPDVGASFRAYLRPDGEIDEWLTKAASNASTESMSLDELVGDGHAGDTSPAQRQVNEH